MHILLPPSETKRDGGEGAGLRLGALAFPELRSQREQALAALAALCADEHAALAALKLGANGQAELARNRALRQAPLLPAADRYTGVLYDALDAPSLGRAARAFLARSAIIHSALFGPVRALDPIPAYRLSADSRLPGRSLREIWREPVSAALDGLDGLVLDLRSESYAKLGPLPGRANSAFVRVVTPGTDGTVRALNHFNKTAKGAFVRRLAQERPQVQTIAGLLRWARRAGIVLRPGSQGELDLFVE